MFSLQGLFEPDITLLSLLPRPAQNLYLCLSLPPDYKGGMISCPPACYSRILSHKMLSYGVILTSPGFPSLYLSFEIFLLFSLCWYMIFALVIVIYPSWFGLQVYLRCCFCCTRLPSSEYSVKLSSLSCVILQSRFWSREVCCYCICWFLGIALDSLHHLTSRIWLLLSKL